MEPVCSPAADGEPRRKVVGEVSEHAIDVLLEEPVQLGDGRAVAEELAEHRLGLAVPRIEPAERVADARAGVGMCANGREVGRRVQPLVVGGAGG